MQLVKLENGPSPWPDIRDAAAVLWRSACVPDLNTITTTLQAHLHNPDLTVSELHTGLNASRRGVVVCNDATVTIAFLGSDPKELHMNLWSFAKNPGFWTMPYRVYENGGQVHSFFRDMWRGMREATYDALSRAVADIEARGATPKAIVVTGFSMGGGVSILAFTDILEHIRHTWGSQCAEPRPWARDENLGSLVQHLTFAAVAAGNQGYYTVLNNLYDHYRIRAWDFLNHRDVTVHTHHFEFRSWRGYRYILPDALERFSGGEFGDNGHGILGYLKVAEWMAEHGTDEVKSAYNY